MIRRTTSFLWRLSTSILIGAVILVSLGVWRLAQGPVDVDFLRSYVSRTVETPQGPVTLAAQHVRLAWAAGEGPVRVVLDDIRAVDRTGTMIARVPEAVVDLNLQGLLSGSFNPTSIVIDSVSLDVVISREGLVSMLLPPSDQEPSARILPLLVEQLLQEPNDSTVFGRLNEVRIGTAKVRIDDRTTGFVWEAPAAGAVLLRDAQGVLVRARTELAIGDEVATLEFNSVYSRNRENIFARLAVENFRPALFASASPELAVLGQLDLPMRGRLEISAAGNGEIRRMTLDLEGSEGKVAIPGVFPEPKRVSSVQLRASSDPRQGRLTLERFDVLFGEVGASLQGEIVTKDRDYTVKGKAELRDVPAARMAEFWPVGFAKGGRIWATENIRDGRLNLATASFAAVGNFDRPEAVQIGEVSATLAYRDATVRYLPALEPVRGVSGTGSFDGKVLRFLPASGHAGPIALKDGSIDIVGLNGPDGHRAEISLRLVASAVDAMGFLEQRQLALPRDVLFNPRRLAGEVDVRLNMRFPLVGLTSIEQVDYSANVTLRRFGLVNVAAGLNLTDGEAILDLDPRGLQVKGRGRVDGVAFDISWRENFGARPAFRRRYEVKGEASMAFLAKAGVVVPEQYATGSVVIDASYQAPVSGPTTVTAKLGLAQMRLAIPELAWDKAAGVEGQATVSARFAGPTPLTVDFEAASAGMAAKGHVDLRASDGAWQQVSLSRLQVGQTDLAGSVKRTGGSLVIDVRGRSLELARVIGTDFSTGPPQRGATQASIELNVDIGQLILKRGAISAVRGTVSMLGDRIARADIRLGGTTQVQIQPGGAGRQVTVRSDNVGALLSAAGWLDGIGGGKLEIAGTTDDSGKVLQLKSKVQVRDVRLVRVKPRNGVGDLNGVIDGLSRLGDVTAPFGLLEMRLDRRGEMMHIRRARANNGAVGVSLSGSINLNNDIAKLEGTGVPAYVLNNLLSAVPVVGTILTGGPGGGMFAIAFSVEGPLDKPRVSINPLSALAPGILRGLFGGGSGGDDDEEGTRSSEPANSGKPP